MKNLVVLALVGFLAWFAYGKYQARTSPADGTDRAPTLAVSTDPVLPAPAADPEFACDGRTYCSQMRSCAEATFFLRHCPSTKMDGNHDGVPCERQWCH